jgi:hypothetical protein
MKYKKHKIYGLLNSLVARTMPSENILKKWKEL